ncbi:LacI family DNA-binding transcriptional regulator [Paracoccus sp. TOH]|uniref:LacI family DNA-binding transcriptional regulator n=1 Tax=Paracoccus sp. TOH TaxID=1263728 RepID=UPI0025B06E7D|nr:LacI family DNA-binding transcriptional regulator [Paracoccus sp. TOH]WJS86601.1 LacI family DNA-binding transcriptional regulator [Paracoccus sp. TOH]
MTRTGRPPRIQDVARLAGVSAATVSRVLSNPAIVAETTRLAVEEAIAETGYTLNVTARNLRQQQVGGVLALVPNLANPFFSQILSGIAEVLRGNALNLLVLDTTARGSAGPEAIGAYLTRSHSDGVIVLDGNLDAALFRQTSCPPVVQACEWIGGLSAPRVLADNAEGGRLAIRHLTGLGHRRILHLTGPEGNSLTVSRRAGVLAGLEAAGVTAGIALPGDFSLRSGHAAAQRILALAEPPTAIFCDNDEMAIGLINGLVQGGLRVPEDISVVGFDNIEMSAYTLPPLTTIRQHRARLGRHAANALLALIDGQPCPEEEILPVELLVRASTAAPMAAPA